MHSFPQKWIEIFRVTLVNISNVKREERQLFSPLPSSISRGNFQRLSLSLSLSDSRNIARRVIISIFQKRVLINLIWQSVQPFAFITADLWNETSFYLSLSLSLSASPSSPVRFFNTYDLDRNEHNMKISSHFSLSIFPINESFWFVHEYTNYLYSITRSRALV